MSGHDKATVWLVGLCLAAMVASALIDAGPSVSGCGVRVEFNSASRDAGGE